MICTFLKEERAIRRTAKVSLLTLRLVTVATVDAVWQKLHNVTLNDAT